MQPQNHYNIKDELGRYRFKHFVVYLPVEKEEAFPSSTKLFMFPLVQPLQVFQIDSTKLTTVQVKVIDKQKLGSKKMELIETGLQIHLRKFDKRAQKLQF